MSDDKPYERLILQPTAQDHVSAFLEYKMITGYKPGDELLPPEEYEKLREKWMENKRARFINYETPQRDEQVRRLRGAQVKRLKFVPERGAPSPFELLQESVKFGGSVRGRKEPSRPQQKQQVGSKRILAFHQLDNGEDSSEDEYNSGHDEFDQEYDPEDEVDSEEYKNKYFSIDEEYNNNFNEEGNADYDTIQNRGVYSKRQRTSSSRTISSHIDSGIDEFSNLSSRPINHIDKSKPRVQTESRTTLRKTSRDGSRHSTIRTGNGYRNSQPSSEPSRSKAMPTKDTTAMSHVQRSEKLTLNDVRTMPEHEQVPILESMMEDKSMSDIQKYAVKRQLAVVKGKLKREEIKLRSKYNE